MVEKFYQMGKLLVVVFSEKQCIWALTVEMIYCWVDIIINTRWDCDGEWDTPVVGNKIASEK